ncbi:MAG TPA: BTAD domain-containing putative transcriptional regulator [Amycolatopsis sp.]|nr:BTAD domain-containing putative transcriptional regulator [Amycolatopsis sp.]
MQFRILGPVAVIGEDGDGIPLGPPRQHALLAVLLLHLGTPLPVGRLVDLLWGDAAPASAATIVHGSIAGLRRALAAGGAVGVLVTEPAGYTVRARADQVDALRFEQLLDEGRKALPADPKTASALLTDAVALWHGPALAGIDAPFVAETATRLDELRCDAIEAKAEADLALGRHAHVVGELEALVARHPLRERPRAHLMVALYRCGRQSEALACYRAARRALREELGVEPGPALRDLHRAVLQQHPSLDPPDATRPARLPRPLGAFVGRSRERAEISDLLDGHRLVTLVGAAGIGKTRLAIEIARAAAARFPAGSWFVDLAPPTTSALVPHTVAGVLGLRAETGPKLLDSVSAALGHRKGLLILDNCEHVVAGCRALAEAVTAAGTEARVLATSREALGIAGEVVCTVAPLPVPDADASWERVAASEAVSLFGARAATARPGFRVTEASAGLVRDICARLDGLPLALELAASQAAALPLRRILDDLDHRSRLLDAREGAAGRHRGLDTACDGSYHLLTDPERIVFARLSVFAGGFTLDAAESVAGDGQDVVSLLSGLVARSLVQLEHVSADRGRYRMLEPLRRYAQGRLAERGEDTIIAERHARHYLAVVEAAQPHLYRADSVRWLEKLRADGENLRAALGWAFGEGGDPELGARLASGLWHVWDLAGARVEGLHWLDAGLAAIDRAQAGLRLPLLAAATLLHLGLGELDAARGRAVEQLTLARATGDRRWEGDALTRLGMVSWARGDPAAARSPLEEAVRALRASGDSWREAIALVHLTRAYRDDDQLSAARTTARTALDVAQRAGEDAILGFCLDVCSTIAEPLGRADELIARALTHYRAIGYREGEASALQVTGRLMLPDRPETARESFRTALELCTASGHRAGMAASLEGLGHTALACDDPRLAATFLGAAAAQRERIHVPAPATARPALDAALARLRSELAAGELALATGRGAAASPDDLLAWAATPATPRSSRITVVHADPDTERLASVLDDQAWTALTRWLEGTLHSCFAEHGARRVHHDGRVATFSSAPAALRCARTIQRRLADHRRDHGFAPRIRIGVHSDPDEAHATDVATAVARAAGYGQILATRATIEAAPESTFAAVDPSTLPDELEATTVEWSGS